MIGKSIMKLLLLTLGISVYCCNAQNVGVRRVFQRIGLSKEIKTGNVERFKELSKYFDPDYRQFLLWETAKKGNETILEFLLQNGTELSETNSHGNTLMIYAATNNNEKIMDLLIKHGGNVNTADSRGNTVLHLAALNSNEKVVETLVNNGANLDAINRRDKESALHWAAINPNEKILDLLIKSGANIHLKNKDEETPLALAALFNTNEKVAELLIKAGANITETNIKGWTPSLCAIINGNGMIRDGIENGNIAPTYPEKKRRECLLNHWKNPVRKHAGEKIIETLINNGVNINQKVTEDQITAYDAAEIIGDESMKQFLIKHGANAGKP